MYKESKWKYLNTRHAFNASCCEFEKKEEIRQRPKMNKGFRTQFFEDYLPKYKSIEEAVRKFCEDKNFGQKIVYGWIKERESKR